MECVNNPYLQVKTKQNYEGRSTQVTVTKSRFSKSAIAATMGDSYDKRVLRSTAVNPALPTLSTLPSWETREPGETMNNFQHKVD